MALQGRDSNSPQRQKDLPRRTSDSSCIYSAILSGLIRNARVAEELGFESFWMGEHIGVPFKISSRLPDYEGDDLPLDANSKFPDPLLALTYLAGQTNKINLGTLVYVLPVRNPFVVAKAVATLDQYSNGRFLFGIGIGWLKEEFDWIGAPWENLALRTNEYIKLMAELWSSPNPAFSGKTIRTQGVNMAPKTVQQPRPPVIIAGTAPGDAVVLDCGSR